MSQNKYTTHHLNLIKFDKMNQLFQICWKLKTEEKSVVPPKMIIMTRFHGTADTLAWHFDFQKYGAASLHKFKSVKENEAIRIKFETGEIRVLVTSDIDYVIDLCGVKHVINYDLQYIRNILHCEEYKTNDVFHTEQIRS